MKKFTAMITFLALFTVMCVPIAWAVTLPGDEFVTGSVTKEANMIHNPQYDYKYGWVHKNAGDDFVTVASKDSTRTGWMSVTTDSTVSEQTLKNNSWNNPHGFRISTSSFGTNASDHDFDGTYVFSAQVKVGNESEVDSVEFGARVESTAFEVKKQTITGKDTWTDFKQNLTATKVNEKYIQNVKFGITDAAVGTKSQIVVNLADANVAPYLAKEQDYDITTKVTSGSAIVPTGTNSMLTVKAELLNQIGLASSDQGTFTWYALNADKSDVATGVTVTGGSDNTATVTVSDTAAAGKYSIVAESNKDKQFVRTLTVEVVNVTEFEGVTKSANLLANPTIASGYSLVSSGDAFILTSSDTTSLTVTTKSETAENSINAWDNPHGIRVLGQYHLTGGENTDFKFKGNYVFSANVKVGEDSEKKEVNFGAYIANGGSSLVSQTITGTDSWTEFKANLTNCTGTNNEHTLRLGITSDMKSTKSQIVMNLSSDVGAPPYLAEEQLFNITNTTTDSTTFTEGVGGSLKATAKLWNQIDLEYSDQGTFSWLAMNEEKTAAVDGIAVTPSDDTNTATVSVGANVPAGTYNIIAISNENASFVRTLPITVKGESVSALTLNTTENSASLAATVENTSKSKVWFFLAAYEETGTTNVMKACKMVEATVSNGTASITAEDCSLTNLSAGWTVKAFVWGDTLQPIEIGSTFTTTGTIPQNAE